MIDAWIAALREDGARLQGSAALDFGAPREELAAVRTGSILAPLSHLALLEFAGDDARTFLHGQVSCDVNGLPASRSVYGSYSTPQGRMLANFLLWAEDSALLMLLARSVQASVRKRLQMYVLRAKVKIADLGEARVLLGASGPAAPEALDRVLGAVPAALHEVARTPNGTIIRVPGDRFVVSVPTDRAVDAWRGLLASLRAVGSPAWEWSEIANGIPLVTAATQDQIVAQMANLELIGGVNFQKGCYPGQEVIARTQYRGKVKRRMFLAHVDADPAPSPGDALYSEDLGDQASGLVVNAAAAPEGGFDVLAVVNAESARGSTVRLRGLQGPALRFGTLPYALP